MSTPENKIFWKNAAASSLQVDKWEPWRRAGINVSDQRASPRVGDCSMESTELEQLRSKIRKYEDFLHAINVAVITCNNEMLRKLVDNAFAWSYAHRVGNGEYSDEEQQEFVDRALDQLTKIS
jgi:hypothetical protein